MLDTDLQKLARRENVTLERRTRNARAYWYAHARHQGHTFSTYLCAESKLSSFTETDFLRKVRDLPGRSGHYQLGIQRLPGQSLRVSRGNKGIVLSYDDVYALAQWVRQQEGSGI